ncbi:CAP domain-containing protein [Corynebacterium choanae]|uniref:SCP domain-containing protein n=1 Tax=Corynebacterium choanae TaxID=1862358 RepID=A0A3G6J6U4_9CORY|nr:CAP domain-containing protein [Corynebacterium choanae]AZA13686.1 hypothetical protein CCHOA_06435 [Corynebacterium choanae]
MTSSANATASVLPQLPADSSIIQQEVLSSHPFSSSAADQLLTPLVAATVPPYVSAEERYLFARVNALRISRLLPPLHFDDTLYRASQHWSDHLLGQPGSGCPPLVHTPPGAGISENLGCLGGAPDPDRLIDLWLHSPPHAANLFHPTATRGAIAFVITPRATVATLQLR